MRKNKKKNIYYIGIAMFTIGIIVSFSIILLTHEIFNIKKININGNYEISKKEIINSSNALGKNIFLVNKNNLKENLINEKIVKIEISRELPNKLNIDIVENRAIAIIRDRDGFYITINIFGEINSKRINQKPDLPEIIGIDIGKIQENISIFDDKNIYTIFNEFNKIDIEILKYDFSNKENIKLKTNNFDILLGNISNLEEKIHFINDVIDSISADNTNVVKIDLSNMEMPLITKE